jgi:serine/threonine-protein kinase
VLDSDPVAPRLLNPKIDKDVETICLKCLHKEPPKRYVSAQALADDLGRYMNHKPIWARPIGRVERVWRWYRREPTLASLIGAVVVVLVIGVLVSLSFAALANQHADEAQHDSVNH